MNIYNISDLAMSTTEESHDRKLKQLGPTPLCAIVRINCRIYDDRQETYRDSATNVV